MHETSPSASLDQLAMPSLAGRVAWVTGASRGIGRVVALALGAAGADLLLSARDGDRLAGVARELRALGRDAEVVTGSVADADDVRRAADVAGERWGRVDVLVNNAGICPDFVPAEQVGERDWSTVLDVNLHGTLRCCQAVLPLMEPAGGSIVNVSSVHGSRTHERLAAYAASKAGVERLTQTLAIEWARRGIRVNAVAPGYVETDLTAGLLSHPHWRERMLARTPLGRFATAAEIALPVVFLASGASSYVTGTTLQGDGGWTAQ